MKKNYLINLFVILVLFVPTVASATTFRVYILTIFDALIEPLLVLFISIALVVFIFGIVKYISAAGDSQKARDGMNMITWGVIGLFVIVSMWGLVVILTGLFGIDVFPEPPTPSSAPPGLFP